MTLVAVGPTRQLVEQVGLDRLMPIIEDVPAARPAPKTAAPPIAARGVTPPPAATPGAKPDRTKPTEPSRSDR